jgi:hypothetical protein
LDRSDEEYLPELRSTVDRALGKIKNIEHIEYLALHYKKQKYKGLRSRYEVKARLKADDTVSVSAADWDIRTVTQEIVKELLTVVKKRSQKSRDRINERGRDRRRD